jgi:hypothetical protein
MKSQPQTKITINKDKNFFFIGGNSLEKFQKPTKTPAKNKKQNQANIKKRLKIEIKEILNEKNIDVTNEKNIEFTREIIIIKDDVLNLTKEPLK